MKYPLDGKGTPKPTTPVRPGRWYECVEARHSSSFTVGKMYLCAYYGQRVGLISNSGLFIQFFKSQFVEVPEE